MVPSFKEVSERFEAIPNSKDFPPELDETLDKLEVYLQHHAGQVLSKQEVSEEQTEFVRTTVNAKCYALIHSSIRAFTEATGLVIEATVSKSSGFDEVQYYEQEAESLESLTNRFREIRGKTFSVYPPDIFETKRAFDPLFKSGAALLSPNDIDIQLLKVFHRVVNRAVETGIPLNQPTLSWFKEIQSNHSIELTRRIEEKRLSAEDEYHRIKKGSHTFPDKAFIMGCKATETVLWKEAKVKFLRLSTKIDNTLHEDFQLRQNV